MGERYFAVIVCLFGMMMFSSFISGVTNAVNQLRALGLHQTSERLRIHRFLKRNSVSNELGLQFEGFFRRNPQIFAPAPREQDIPSLAYAPESLRIQLHKEIYLRWLQSNCLYRNENIREHGVLLHICHYAMEEALFSTEQDIFIPE